MLHSTEELGGSGAKEELPECSEWGERNLGISDGSKVPRLSKQEQNLRMNFGRPLYMEEWREMSKETKWGTLENRKMAFYGDGKTSE